ncbi:MAG: DUF4126 domain-containing protein [Elainellaceae cyanobacterium]
MFELLAALSIAAAAGLRLALPLLVLGLLSGNDLWSQVPLLSLLRPAAVLGVLVSWSLLELVVSKDRVGHRVLQMVELVLSPVVGAIAGIAVVTYATGSSVVLFGVIGVVSALLAFVLRLVQLGWFYRLRGLPLWFILVQDVLCVVLVFLALDAPHQGGLIALFLLWLAIRSSSAWQRYSRPSALQRYRSSKANDAKEPRA